MKKNLAIILFISLIVFCHLYEANSQQPEVLVYDLQTEELKYDSIQFQKDTPQPYNYYKFRVKKKFENKFLLVILQGMTPGSDPDAYISYINQNPTKQDYDLSCAAFFFDVCIVPHTKVVANEYIYIGVTCPGNCSYSLRTFYQEEYIVETNDERYIYFDNTDQQIVKIHVNQLTYDDFHSVIIESELMNPQDVKHTFSLYFNLKNQIPDEQNYEDMLDQLGAGSGKGVVNIDGTFKLDDNFTFLYKAKPGSIIAIRVFAYNKMRNIKPFQVVEDYILSYQQKTFKLTLDQDLYKFNFSQYPLLFTIIPYNGNPQVFVNGDIKPPTLDKYLWSTDTGLEQRIVIFPEERKAAGISDKEFYITINTQWQESMFTLKVYPISQDSVYLSFNFPEAGSLYPNEYDSYHFVMYGMKPANLTVDISRKQGNPNLYVKRCSKDQKISCSISLDEITSLKSSDSDFFIYSNYIQARQTLRFTHDPKACKSNENTEDEGDKDSMHNGFPSCAYVVAVWANNTLDNKSLTRYEIELKQDNQNTMLRDLEPIHDMVENGNYNYYKYKVNTTDLQNIKFQVTPISGEVSMYLSRTVVMPNEADFDLDSFWNYISIDKPEPGWYYIGVQGESIAYYTIMVSTNYQDMVNKTISYIKLSEDVSQEITLEEDSNTYFKFTVNSTNDKLNLTVNLKPLKGKFDMYIKNNKATPPSATDKQWKDVNNIIKINFDDPNFPANGVFYGVIIPDNNQELHNLLKFKLEYHTTVNINTLTIGESHQDIIHQGEIKYFKYQVFGNDTISIFKKSSNLNQSSVQVFCSINQDIQRPNQQNNTCQSTGDKQIIIEKDDIQKYCPFLNIPLGLQQKQCYIFVTVMSSEQTYYTLSSKYTEKPVILSEGGAQDFGVPNLGQYSYFLIFLPSNETVTIYMRSYAARLFMYAQIQHYDKENQDPVFPTKNNYSLSSEGKNHHNSYNLIEIKPEQLKNQGCTADQDCVLALSVLNNDSDISAGQYNLYSLSISIGLVQLQEAVPIFGSLEPKQIRYYSLFNSQDDTTIVVSLTPLNDGDADLFISFGEDERPVNAESSDWKSQYQGSDNVIIQKNSNNKLKKSMKGVYIIAVSSQFDIVKYQLSYTIGKQYYYLTEGAPFDINLLQDQSVYFEYSHYFSESFKIILTRQYGQAEMAITTYQGKEEFLKDLPNIQENKNIIWSNHDMGNQDQLKISKNDKNFCSYTCRYIIQIHALESCQLTTLLIVDNQQVSLPNNKRLEDYLSKGEQTQFVYQASRNFYIKFLLTKGNITVSYQQDQGETKLVQPQSRDFEITVPFTQVNCQQQGIDCSKQQQMYYMISVTALQDTIYSIQVQNENQTTMLNYGQMYSNKLLPQQENEYQFINNVGGGSDSQKNMTVNINLNNIEFKNATKFKKLKPVITLMFQPYNIEKFEEVTFIDKYETDKYYRYVIAGQQGTYLLKIQNNQKYAQELNFTLKYSIMVSKLEIVTLQVGHIYSFISKAGQVDRFQIYVGYSSKLYIESNECDGNVKIIASKNYQNLIKSNNEVGDIRLEKIDKKVQAFIADIDNEGYVFLLVKTIDGNNSNYNLMAHIYNNQTTIPYDSFTVGQYGLTNHLILKDTETQKSYVNISFQALSCEDQCLNLGPQLFIYYLTITKNMDYLSTLRACPSLIPGHNFNQDLYGNQSNKNNASSKQNNLNTNFLYYSELFYDQDDHPYGKNIDFKVFVDSMNIDQDQFLKTDQIYYQVSVQVVMNEQSYDGYKEILKFYYEPTALQMQQLTHIYSYEEKERFPFGWLLLGITFFILLAIGFLVIYRKLRKVEQQLNFEMTDVRNVAKISNEMDQPQQLEHNQEVNPDVGKKYKGFIDEDKDEDKV